MSSTIEVRVGPQGCKAKWVRIELKKVETLPGGGPQNTFSDFVGPSPVNLWQASGEEYGLLPTQDFPFYIRIPESIPPSIALDKGAGIRYELVATNTIFLDKHELHSTWPVYSQAESRNLPQDGVTLTVERSRTCYGPGDRVSVNATLRSDNLHTVIVRGFEFTLKETTIFRAGAHATGKNRAPVVRENIIGEQKVPVNVTLYGGTTHKAELACIIPQHHTTTSLSAARHIDITYVLLVKALMGTGTHLVMELPVMISNWPRNVSVELVKRIGTAPSLSLGAAANPHHVVGTHTRNTSNGNGLPLGSLAEPLDFGRPTTANSSHYGGTMPPMSSKAREAAGLDEFGYKGSKDFTSANTAPTRVQQPPPQDEFANRPVEPRPAVAGRRPGTANSATGRFTVTNLDEKDHHRNESSPPATARNWLPAEEEKKRLYEQARAEVARVQGDAASPPTTRPVSPPLVAPSLATTTPRKGTWMTAEQEKTRLYEQAQATATRTQGSAGHTTSPPTSPYSPAPPAQTSFSGSPYKGYSPGGSGSHGRPPSAGPQPIASVSSIPVASAGAALYQSAIANMHRSAAESGLPSPPPSRGNGSLKAVPAYASAEEEKAALRRYHEAKNAVSRTQGIQSPVNDPISYDSLYPSAPAASTATPSGNPPPFAAPPSGSHILNEKERLRRAYEAQDAALLASQQQQAQAPPPQSQSPAYSSPPAAFVVPAYAPAPLGPPGTGPNGFLSEKELLRQKFAADDAAAMNASPSRNASFSPVQNRTPPRREPTLDTSAPIAGQSNILSAVEEKALLRAKYEAEERATNGNGSLPPSASYSNAPTASAPTTPYRKPSYQAQPSYAASPPASAYQTPVNESPPPSFGQIPIKNNTIPTPPPLRPRPPVEYIQETQEVDALVRRESVRPTEIAHEPGFTRKKSAHELDLRPFTPFQVGINEPGPPPPLPPKRFDSTSSMD
ncbi:hypothetical protein HWV62_3002 [Athelia sp. TMB]|nr:hypothetical protein HWV62_3002 [Athelia sp. TMB]